MSFVSMIHTRRACSLLTGYSSTDTVPVSLQVPAPMLRCNSMLLLTKHTLNAMQNSQTTTPAPTLYNNNHTCKHPLNPNPNSPPHPKQPLAPPQQYSRRHGTRQGVQEDTPSQGKLDVTQDSGKSFELWIGFIERSGAERTAG